MILSYTALVNDTSRGHHLPQSKAEDNQELRHSSFYNVIILLFSCQCLF